MAKDNPLSASTREEWEAKRGGVLLTLPASGLVVRARPIGIQEAIMDGVVPDELTATIAGLMQTADGEIDLTSGNAVTTLREFGPICNAIVCAGLLEPRFSTDPTPPDGALPIAYIPATDRQQLFAWMNGDARALEPFRPKHQGDVEPGGSGEGV
ncbi:MAG: hypothetical protein WC683_14145 [bacterium]